MPSPTRGSATTLFEMSGVLSRKKQMMPYLTDLIRQLEG